LKHNRVTAEIDLPPRAPKHTLLRLRLPDDYKISSANMSITAPETFDLTGQQGHCSVAVKVSGKTD
jgi:hypothetical protein